MNGTIDFYRYIDCTTLTRITLDFLRETIERELPAELKFLTMYDAIRIKMQGVVEMPDRIASLFVKPVRQNGGTLPKKKRHLPEFTKLTDGEIAALEAILRDGPATAG